jgi:hypothetical protein
VLAPDAIGAPTLPVSGRRLAPSNPLRASRPPVPSSRPKPTAPGRRSFPHRGPHCRLDVCGSQCRLRTSEAQTARRVPLGLTRRNRRSSSFEHSAQCSLAQKQVLGGLAWLLSLPDGLGWDATTPTRPRRHRPLTTNIRIVRGSTTAVWESRTVGAIPRGPRHERNREPTSRHERAPRSTRLLPRCTSSPADSWSAIVVARPVSNRSRMLQRRPGHLGVHTAGLLAPWPAGLDQSRMERAVRAFECAKEV